MVEPAPGELGNHVLPARHFDALSQGFGDVETIRLLWNSERSRRLILVRALLDGVADDPTSLGPLPAAETVWDTLIGAQAVAPAEFDAVLLHPQLGSWLAYALRRQRGGADSDAPLWIDCGSVHVLALAVAARAGIPCRIRIPLRNGRVMLPAMGLAQFPDASPWDFAEADAERGRIRLRHGARELVVPGDVDDAAGGWLSLRRLSMDTDPPLRLWINDVDPFRDLADPVSPERLSGEAIARWRQMAHEAWDILRRDHFATAEALSVCVVTLVPLPAGDGWDTRSASTGDAFGSVMMSPPPDATTLAVSLVHEFMHIKLGGLLHLVQLTVEDAAHCMYAPWRDDPRPVAGFFQGIYAFLGIAAFWREHRSHVEGPAADLATFEYLYARLQTAEGLATIAASEKLTAEGRRFVEGLASRVRSWSDDVLPADLVDLATTIADGHRAGWLIRHRRPDPQDVSSLAKAWKAGDAAPPVVVGAAIVPHAVPRWSQPRLGLARRRLVEPIRYRQISPAPAWAEGLVEADFDLIAGDTAKARNGYGALLKDDPEDLNAWTGLGLALAGDGPAATALLREPEVVYAVHTELRIIHAAPQPVELAAWIGARGNEAVPHTHLGRRPTEASDRHRSLP